MDAPEGETTSRSSDLARLRAATSDWAPPEPEILASVRADALLRHDIFDRPPFATWGRGRVTLLGDAAHPMTPNLGQGGCAAIEDALVVADALAASSDVPAALRAYERRRHARTALLIRRSRFVGRVGQERGPVFSALRNTLMRLRPRWSYRRELRSYLSHDTTTA
jgi:2-polyprenyl-6-methoxyphenol hydroxylase-like FAD-dependent oxidoreductase